MTLDGQFTFFDLTPGFDGVSGLTVGSDGRLWFTEGARESRRDLDQWTDRRILRTRRECTPRSDHGTGRLRVCHPERLERHWPPDNARPVGHRTLPLGVQPASGDRARDRRPALVHRGQRLGHRFARPGESLNPVDPPRQTRPAPPSGSARRPSSHPHKQRRSRPRSRLQRLQARQHRRCAIRLAGPIARTGHPGPIGKPG